jgi:hypothetical protein
MVSPRAIRPQGRWLAAAAVIWLLALAAAPRSGAASSQVAQPNPHTASGPPAALFLTSHECVACHNGLIAPDGEDVSIGTAWRATIMANASRDPYWQAGVRREILDHPAAAAAIEDECSICHMPMARTQAHAGGREGQIFAHLPIGAGLSAEDRLAADGVSCTMCHQIGPERLGTPESFTGGFVISPAMPAGERQMFGPFTIDPARASIMHSATGMVPVQADHVRESELCATCHTLYTQALGDDGQVIGRLPEQVPYLEWRHSAFRGERSCQSCHMPAVREPTPIASVLGVPREGMGRHTFLGGNFFLLRMLNRLRTELGVEALPQELDAAAHATMAQLQSDTAAIALVAGDRAPGEFVVDVTVRNLTGHKLPTAYPSRRAWLHVTVRDDGDRVVFESGAIDPSGLVRGNDNDADPARFEPHYTEIRREDDVQIYESIMHDPEGGVTTGLLSATGYVKDNRLLPRGFDKATAVTDIAVVGAARADADFAASGDRIRYVVDTRGRRGPFRVDVELRYQPISYRWAHNLRPYAALETTRFLSAYEAMASGSSAVLARASGVW